MPWIISTTLTVFVPLILLYWYTGSKIANSLTIRTGWGKKKARKIVWSLVAYVNAFPVLFLIVFLLSGRSRLPAFTGENFIIDLLFAYPFWFGLVITVQLSLLFLLTEIPKFVLWSIYRRQKEQWLGRQSYVVLTMAALIAVYSITVIVLNTWTITVHEREFRLPGESAGLDGLTVVHISDVQGDGRTSPSILRGYVRRINELKPDLVLFAGDLVTSGEDYIESSADILGVIEARYAKIAAVGDHDIFSDKNQVLAALRRNGFLIDDDTTITVKVDTTRISVTLLTHTYRQRPDLNDLERAKQGADGDLKIFLVHQPAEALIRFAGDNGYDLFMAGHTHGGGVAFGIPGIFLLSPARLESPFVSGFYEVGSMLVSVTNGIGMTLAPIRFHAQSEISVVKLVR